MKLKKWIGVTNKSLFLQKITKFVNGEEIRTLHITQVGELVHLQIFRGSESTAGKNEHIKGHMNVTLEDLRTINREIGLFILLMEQDNE